MNTPGQHTTKDSIAFIVREATPDDAEQLLAGTRSALDEGLDYLITHPEEADHLSANHCLWHQTANRHTFHSQDFYGIIVPRLWHFSPTEQGRKAVWQKSKNLR
jgi:hypothetical protein